KKFASDVGRAGDLIIGGGAINSATTFGSGLPFTPSLSSCGPSSDVGPCRPDILGSIKDGTRSGNTEVGGYWFQTTDKVKLDTAPGASNGPWAQPGVEQFGNIGRNSMRGPKIYNTDFSVFKTFSFTERIKTQFQFTAYNVFNHV